MCKQGFTISNVASLLSKFKLSYGFYFVDWNCSFAGFYTREWWKEKDDAHDCTVAQLEKAIEGYFTADALPLSLSNKPGISGKVSTTLLQTWLPLVPPPPDHVAGFLWILTFLQDFC